MHGTTPRTRRSQRATSAWTLLPLALALVAWAPAVDAAPTSYYAEDPSGDQEPPLDAAYDVRYLEVEGTSEAFTVTVGHGGEPGTFRRSTQVAFETQQHAHVMGCSVGDRNPAQASTTSCFAETYPKETPTNVAVGEDFSDQVRFEVEDDEVRFHLDADALGETTRVRMESIVVQVHAMAGADAPQTYAETGLMEADTFRPDAPVLVEPAEAPETAEEVAGPSTNAPAPVASEDTDQPSSPEALATVRQQSSPGVAPALSLGALGVLAALRRRD